MKIDFEKTEEKCVPHFNGGEKEIFLKMISVPGETVLMGRLAPGASVGLHAHRTDSETVCVLSGTGKAICDGELERLVPGSVHYCPKGCSHSQINDGEEELRFFAVVPKG